MTVTSMPSDTEFVSEATEAFRDFGAYNNYRAIASVIDGLRPGARRVLWAMSRNGAVPGRRTVKAMSAIGDVLKYHPHGDSGTYDSMVSMAHSPSEGDPVKRLVPLIHGQGSWGDLDNGAAAPRYTECRLNERAMALLGIDQDVVRGPSEIDENGVDLVPNYSGDLLEPPVLPALFPNFVVNGADGIGLGIATQSASHNLGEVMELAIQMLSTDPRWSTVQKLLPGPDMPCDADIFDGPEGNDIRSYMETGHGSFLMRARYSVEEYKITSRRKGHEITIVGLPYRISPTMVVEGILSLIDAANLPQDLEVANYTDSSGIRVVVDVKENDPDDIVQRLLYYGSTSRMQTSFSVYSRASVDGKVETLGTIDAIRHWIDHRRVVVRRRTRYRLERAEERIEVIQGFLKAIPLAEKIIEVVRSSKDRSEAAKRMTDRWEFTQPQTTAILDLTIGQITRLGVDRYERERDELEAKIRECRDILADQSTLDAVLRREMRAVRDAHGPARRCTLRLDESPYVDRPSTPAVEIPAVPGYLARTGTNFLRWVSKRSIKGIVGQDHVVQFVRATDQNMLEGISTWGYHYRAEIGSVPDKKPVKADSLFGLDPGEELVLANSSISEELGSDIVLITKDGMIKRIDFDVYGGHREGKHYSVINLGDGDSVQHAFFLPPGKDVALLTGYGRLLRIANEDLLSKGRAARGNPAIRLDDADNDSVVWAGAVDDEDQIIYWNSEERVGWFSAGEVEPASRATMGRTITRSEFLIKGAIRDGGSELRWFTGSLEEPQTVTLDAPSSGVGLSDRQLRVEAPDILKAPAIWTNSIDLD